MSNKVIPFSLKDAPSLIEKLFPVQKLSAEVFKERKAGAGQTLVPLGAYWKGRKPLILNKACILGCLLPATGDPKRDLEVFEMLMGMDEESFVARWPRQVKPKDILAKLAIPVVSDFFEADPPERLPESSPVNPTENDLREVRIKWRDDVSPAERLRFEVLMLPKVTYRKRVELAKRPEEKGEKVHEHIWPLVNSHLGTEATSLSELVKQLGLMRFGGTPKVADTFSGSGQIPFEAARLGCEVYASDLNPVACMLTWGAFHVVGSTPKEREQHENNQKELMKKVLSEIDKLGIETDGRGWRAKAFLYCLEVRCPQTGWMVPLLPSRIISFGKRAIADLIPNPKTKSYDIEVRCDVSDEEMLEAKTGTLQSEGRGQEPFMIHVVDGKEHREKISTLRGDYRDNEGNTKNNLRPWDPTEFRPRPDDIFQERLYAVHWMKPKSKGKQFHYEFRTAGVEDLRKEKVVEDYLDKHFTTWQKQGWIPDMRIETGVETARLSRERGWTHWHHLFSPRHILLLGLIRREAKSGFDLLMLSRLLDYTSKLCRWTTSKAGTSGTGGGGRTGGASDNPTNVFYNQALNTFYNFGLRATFPLLKMLDGKLPALDEVGDAAVHSRTAVEIEGRHDIYVTDPPYGDAVKYEEILEFFIAWLRKNPPAEFADWVWDSRRSMAIKGEDEDFRRGMVAAYKRMTECMPDNGIQVIMFTHQSGSIWADMANIVWASGLQVTAAWYVVTETESALRDGNNVKGTVLLVCRKRLGKHKTTRDELAWEIEEEVQSQVESLTGLNQQAKGLYRDENVFEDADIQMAGYAAALRVLTRYSTIDGRDMASESIRPRVKGEVTFVDDLIGYAVNTANQCLVPQGVSKSHWDKLSGAERFYLKMVDMEARGFKTLDNYQNFAKAFKVRDFQAFMASRRANSARLKSAVEFARAEMGEGSELHQSVLRAVLYGVMELTGDVETDDVLSHLTMNVPNWFGDMNGRAMAKEFADYLAKRLEGLRPEEAASARVLRDLIRNQRIG